MATTTASWVGSRLCGDRECIVVGLYRCGFVLAQGVVGLHCACVILHVMFFHKRDIVGPHFGEILYAEDIFEFFTQAMVQGYAHHCIIPIEVWNSALELSIVRDEVSVALAYLGQGPFGSIYVIGVSIPFFKRHHKGFKIFEIDIVIFHEVDHVF
jgi:hypothetical protein